MLASGLILPRAQQEFGTDILAIVDAGAGGAALRQGQIDVLLYPAVSFRRYLSDGLDEDASAQLDAPLMRSEMTVAM